MATEYNRHEEITLSPKSKVYLLSCSLAKHLCAIRVYTTSDNEKGDKESYLNDW